MYELPIYCTQCARKLESREIGPGRSVPVCPSCGAVHWIDPAGRRRRSPLAMFATSYRYEWQDRYNEGVRGNLT